MTDTARLDPTAPDATLTDEALLEEGFERHRTELTAYCYRMLGSGYEADDAVQETLVRAWRAFDRFEGRSSVRSWLYRIASNVCFDMLRGRKRRAMPIDVTELGHADAPVAPPTSESNWIQPIPDGRVVSADDPAEMAEARESIRLAFVTALQHLPARQRAVLILREVLKWKASEVAELLDTTVVSVNSALQRARTTLAERNVSAEGAPSEVDDDQRELLRRYVEAFERYDIESLVQLLHDDVTMSMPPYPLWLRGTSEFHDWMVGPGHGCAGSRIESVGNANGAPAFAQWRVSPDGGYDAWAIHVLQISGGVITGIDYFVDPELFALFDAPLHLDA